jgi:rSAM/selenodomain-associated transferase 1
MAPSGKTTRVGESPAQSFGNSMSGAGRPALIIFAKAPIPGQVKTRLSPPLTPDEAATLHGSLVLDVLERTRLSGVERYLVGSPSADHVFFKIMEARHDVQLVTQQGDDLGERMRHAFEAVLTRGHRKAVLIGTDVPLLSSSLVAQALAMLETHELVLGPALDGGYYLIGLTRLVPELFTGIAWSSDRVCALTHEHARALDLRTGLLPSYRDLDTVDDVLALAQTLEPTPKGSRHSRMRDSQSSNISDASGVSDRTADVLRSLADRIRSRSAAGQSTTER